MAGATRPFLQMSIELIILLGLATWRVSSLIVNEDGPFDLFLNIRKMAGIVHGPDGRPMVIPEQFFAELLSCVWCSSIWVGAAWALFWLLFPSVAISAAAVFSLSTIAIILEKWLN